MRRRIDVEAEAVALPLHSARSCRSQEREESPRPPSVYSSPFHALRRNESPSSASSSYGSQGREESPRTPPVYSTPFPHVLTRKESTLSASSSYRFQGREESPCPPSVYSSPLNVRTKKESPPSAASSYSSLTRDEEWLKRSILFPFSSGASNSDVKSLLSSDGDTCRTREMEMVSLVESGLRNDSNERERNMFGGFEMRSSPNKSQIDGKQYSIPFLPHVGRTYIGNRRFLFLFTMIMGLLVFVVVISFVVSRATTMVMRKQLVFLLDRAHVYNVTEGISSGTGAPCSLVYTLSNEPLKEEKWEEKGLNEAELELLATIMARICR